MTTKRTHGPCTCWPARASSESGHLPDCPSLYPAQQEPDALTRLVRYIRTLKLEEAYEDMALTIISEARDGQRKALVSATNEGLEHAATIARELAGKATGYPERQKAALDIAVLILEAKDSEP